MKKLDIICIIIGVICFLLAGYIVYIKFFKENKIDFNKEEEIKLLDDKLAKIGTPLGWLIITDGIDHQNEDGTKYNISYGTNLLKEYSNRQLFTMKYILSTKNENDKFILLSSFDNNKIEGEPTDDYTLAYLDYDTFNKYYKDLFGEDFDLEHMSKDRFQTTVLANVIKTFFGWVFTYAGEIQIVGPEGVCKEYRKQLRKALK